MKTWIRLAPLLFLLYGSSSRAQLILGTGPNNAAPGCTTPSGASSCRDPATISGDTVNILDYSSFSAAVSTGKAILLPANSHIQANNTGYTVINNDLIFEAGAQLSCNGSLDLVINGGVTAPRSYIFQGCLPNFYTQTGKTSVGYPEWWGAAGDYSGGGTGTGTDNTAAFQNAINSGIGVLQLGARATYRLGNTISISRDNVLSSGYG